MDKKIFEKVWETEYLCARVKRISEAVERDNLQAALDMLSMIQDKSKEAERLIKDDSSKR